MIIQRNHSKPPTHDVSTVERFSFRPFLELRCEAMRSQIGDQVTTALKARPRDVRRWAVRKLAN